MTMVEWGKHGWENVGSIGQGAADREAVLLTGLNFREVSGQYFGRPQHVLSIVIERSTRFGEDDSPAVAYEDRCTCEGLQVTDLGADRRLGEAERLGCSSEAPVI